MNVAKRQAAADPQTKPTELTDLGRKSFTAGCYRLKPCTIAI